MTHIKLRRAPSHPTNDAKGSLELTRYFGVDERLDAKSAGIWQNANATLAQTAQRPNGVSQKMRSGAAGHLANIFRWTTKS